MAATAAEAAVAASVGVASATTAAETIAATIVAPETSGVADASVPSEACTASSVSLLL